MHRLFQYIREEKASFEERIDPKDMFRVYVVEPQLSLERIRAQADSFLVSAFHERFEREEVISWNYNIPVYAHYRCKIPASAKGTLHRDLQLVGVMREALFPGLDESAAAITQHYRNKQRKKGTG